MNYIKSLVILVNDPIKIPNVIVDLERLEFRVTSFSGILSNITVDGLEKDIEKIKTIDGVSSVSLNTVLTDLFSLNEELIKFKNES